jgi:hypothetical protein
MKRIYSLRRFESLWHDAESGNWVALVPCWDDGDLMKACKRLLDARLRGWIGFGAGERSDEDLVVAISEDEAQFRTFLSRVQNEAGLSTVVAEGFDLSLCQALRRGGKVRAVVRTPFGLSSRTESSSEGLVLSFDPPPEQPRPTPMEWFGRLQEAYAELQGYQSFVFNGHYE